MSDPANPNPATTPPPNAEGASQTPPSDSATSSTPTTPSGGTSTVLTEQTGGDASDTKTETEQTKTETEEKAATPVDVAKLSFPEELGKPDETMLNEFANVAKSLNLSQEGAQQLADLHTKAIKAASEANTQLWAKTIETWENEIKSDPDIGGDKLKQHQTNFARVLADPRFHVDGVIEALNTTGAGSNPAINRFIAKLVGALSEGGMVQGSPGSAREPRSAAQRLYPNNPSEAAR